MELREQLPTSAALSTLWRTGRSTVPGGGTREKPARTCFMLSWSRVKRNRLQPQGAEIELEVREGLGTHHRVAKVRCL
jgi:hypothetical protein